MAFRAGETAAGCRRYSRGESDAADSSAPDSADHRRRTRSVVSPVSAAPHTVYFPTTQHALSEPYLSRWLDMGGSAQIGDPVSEVVFHEVRQTQFFQYGVLVQRSSERVARLKTGSLLLAELQSEDTIRSDNRRTGSVPIDGAFLPIFVSLAPSSVNATPVYSVDPALTAFYTDKGGAAYFGQPLSSSYLDRGHLVQWFEYGRIEVVDGFPTLAPIGFELAVALGIDLTPTERGDRPLFDPLRFRNYVGDGAFPNADGEFTPVRLQIPRIGVNAVVEAVGVDAGVMGVPVNAWNVGWYPSISTPGEGTNVVLAGHRDWWGVGPVVFWNLSLLQPGDKIYLISADGTAATYQVSLSWLVDADIDAGLLVEDTGFEALTLITCGGTFNGAAYDSRQIIRASRI